MKRDVVYPDTRQKPPENTPTPHLEPSVAAQTSSGTTPSQLGASQHPALISNS